MSKPLFGLDFIIMSDYLENHKNEDWWIWRGWFFTPSSFIPNWKRKEICKQSFNAGNYKEHEIDKGRN